MRLQRILIPVDFSSQAEQASALAVELANRHSAEVVLLHADPLPGAGTIAVEPVYIPPSMLAGLRATYDQDIQNAFAELENTLRPQLNEGATLRTERCLASPVDGILEFAKEWDADLIVMGSSGLSGTARLLLGSTADKITRHAPCPVLVTRMQAPEQRPPQPFRQILVGIDHSPFSGPLARLATSVVAPAGVIELVHIWSPPFVSVLGTHLGGIETTEWTTAREAVIGDEAKRLEDFAQSLDLSGINCFIGAGNVPDALLDRADEHKADLIVVGAHGRRELGEKLIGTVTDRLLRHAHLSVLVLPEGGLPRWTL
ncbi:universal stress protein [Haliangium ochraceum]|uniref:UspA domain protein n=1 Tax=Haliangium ochraceum (strain DSM 14365 / JCM 11303 / SMP-2) TaxID=502025 RepID=D0LSH5_HALO1|nr:universal stress protein [Haliangium ochraceum]ACY15674.1 UspA domain protein [Haliangium ochraceum DSM 14365]